MTKRATCEQLTFVYCKSCGRIIGTGGSCSYDCKYDSDDVGERPKNSVELRDYELVGVRPFRKFDNKGVSKARRIVKGVPLRRFRVAYQIAPWPSKTRHITVIARQGCGATGLALETLMKKHGRKSVRLLRRIRVLGVVRGGRRI
jgi:hypothetical protein